MQNFTDADRANYQALVKELKALKHEDEILYHILSVDIWALAKTMDEYHPGFWNKFMANRNRGMKKFLEELKAQHPPSGEPSPRQNPEEMPETTVTEEAV